MQIANAPCSWGVLEDAASDKAIGYRRMLDELDGKKRRAK